MHQHTLTESPYEDYLICEVCASLFRKDPVDLPAIYEGKRYWESETNHPKIWEQVHNCNVHEENGLTKNDFVLNKLPKGMDVVAEIACAPGILLNRLIREGYAVSVIGFEVDQAYEADIRAIAGVPVDLRFGYFPSSSAHLMEESVDAIIGLDVLEHVPNPEMFLKRCAELLTNKGKLILMLPMVNDDGSVTAPQMIHPEHLSLFSRIGLLELLTDAGFTDVMFSKWTEGHECVEAVKA